MRKLYFKFSLPFADLNEDQLQLKKQICEEILTIVGKLSLGQCEIKGESNKFYFIGLPVCKGEQEK